MKPFHKNLNNNPLASDFGKAFVQQYYESGKK
jgi:hypothetical protein